jgi:hypothetical protein
VRCVPFGEAQMEQISQLFMYSEPVIVSVPTFSPPLPTCINMGRLPHFGTDLTVVYVI